MMRAMFDFHSSKHASQQP